MIEFAAVTDTIKPRNNMPGVRCTGINGREVL
jgi:hypothetical protein